MYNNFVGAKALTVLNELLWEEKMKKIIALVLAVLFVCGALAACGGNAGNNTKATADQKTDATTAAKTDFKAGFKIGRAHV